METIEYNDLEFIDIFDWAEGAYSYNRRCTYNGQIYVCKTFKDNNYLKGRKRKLNLISEIDNPRLITPKFWVKKSGKTNQYLCPYYEGENIEKLKLKPDINTTIKILLDAKNAILSMHQNKIIHSDAHDQNIIYNGTDTRILDFDNATFGRYLTNINNSNEYTKFFVSKYGIKEELDIYLFNLSTYEIINDISFRNILRVIKNGRYGLFNNSYSRKICNSFFLDDKVPNKDFLIDTIADTICK